LRSKLLRLVAYLDFNVSVAILPLHGPEWHVLRLLLYLGELAADETLGRENGVAWVCDGLPLGSLAD
jgi:hypothetical protein